ncbi:MAG: EAL domain-containing protein [Clostridia bacterium]|nr:EAL domain-containing protein [Clostridia bacterium]
MRSIQTKIVALVLSCILLLSTAISIFVYTHTTKLLRAEAQDNMLMSCEIYSESLNAVLSQTESSVNLLASSALYNLTSMQVLQDNRQATYISYLRGVALDRCEGMEGVVGVYAYFDEQIAQTKDCGFFYTRATDGDAFTEQTLTDVSLYDEQDVAHVGWWYKPQQAKAAVWLDAYTNANTEQAVTSYVVPLYKNEQFVGIIGVDIAVSYLAQATQDIRLFDTGFATVLNNDGSVVYHPKYAFGVPLDEEDNSFRDVILYMQQAQECTELISYRMDTQRRHLAFSPLKNGMWLCITAPDAEIYFDLYNMLATLLIMIAVFTCAAACGAVLVTRRMTKPLKQLNYAAHQLTKDNFDAYIAPSTKDEIGELTVSFMKAQAQLKARISSLYDEAHMDGLTGVQNKTALVAREQEINRKIDDYTASFTVAVFDVNGLKVTNDVLGHIAGDDLLRTIAQHLKQTFSPTDVFRTGGDEFVVLLEGPDTVTQTQHITACAMEMETQTLPEHPDIRVSCAFGVASFDPTTDECFAQTLSRADRKMYKNKAISKQENSDPSAKGMRRVQIEKYLEFLKVLSQNTEDYLFLLDIENDKNWFFGDIDRDFAIREDGQETNSLEQMYAITHPSDRRTLSLDLKKIVDGTTDEHHMEYRWINRSGAAVWIDCHGHVVKDSAGHPFIMIGRVSDKALRPLYNPLTGLFNKTKLEQDTMEKSLIPFTHMMLIRIDKLSSISLKYGKQRADELIALVGRTLEERLPISSIYHTERGGFALLLYTNSTEHIERVFESLQTLDEQLTVSAAIVPNDRSFYIDEDNIYESARELFEENRRAGSKTISFFSHDDIHKRLSRAELLDEIEHGVKHGLEGFYLQFQPQVRGSDYAVVSAEALLRYRSAVKGAVYPNEFIPLLEETRLIRPVGHFVLDRALQQCRAWRHLVPDFRMAVNFSSVQLKEDGIADEVIALLKKHELPGDALTLELTESVEIDSTTDFADVFEAFQNAGIRIAIDDFGTGYANLGYLKNIYADEIKIDRVFIKDLKENTYNYTVLNNIIDFAKTNAFTACVEGVESTEELAVLEGLEPDLLQGYLFSRPIEAEELEALYLRPSYEGRPIQQPFMRELRQSRDELRVVHVDTKGILAKINIGLWVIRIHTAKARGELFADAMMHRLLGIDTPCDGATCYELWRSRIKDEHRERVDDMIRHMMESDQVMQVEYVWTHPTKGDVLVRCTGKCVTQTETSLVFEGFHRILSDVVDEDPAT